MLGRGAESFAMNPTATIYEPEGLWFRFKNGTYHTRSRDSTTRGRASGEVRGVYAALSSTASSGGPSLRWRRPGL